MRHVVAGLLQKMILGVKTLVPIIHKKMIVDLYLLPINYRICFKFEIYKFEFDTKNITFAIIYMILFHVFRVFFDIFHVIVKLINYYFVERRTAGKTFRS